MVIGELSSGGRHFPRTYFVLRFVGAKLREADFPCFRVWFSGSSLVSTYVINPSAPSQMACIQKVRYLSDSWPGRLWQRQVGHSLVTWKTGRSNN